MADSNRNRIIRKLIKDPLNLISYIERYASTVAGVPYVIKEITDSSSSISLFDGNGYAQVHLNDSVEIKGKGKVKDLVNALVFRYIGTEGLRKVSILLIRRGNRIYRINDLPSINASFFGLMSILLISLFSISLVAMVFRLLGKIPSLHAILILLLTPLLAPVIYAHILRISVKGGNIDNASIIKFTILYDELDNDFETVTRLLTRISNSKSLNEIRRFVYTLSSIKGVVGLSEDVMDINELRNRLGIRKNVHLYLVNMNQCNAASIGFPGLNYVLISTRLVSCLDNDELMAVVAHELGHIRHGDSVKLLFLISLSQALNVAFITYLTSIISIPVIPSLLGLVLMELLLIMWVMKFSEYSADKYALNFVNKSMLMNALKKVAWRELYVEVTQGKSRIFSMHPPVIKRVIKIVNHR